MVANSIIYCKKRVLHESTASNNNNGDCKRSEKEHMHYKWPLIKFKATYNHNGWPFAMTVYRLIENCIMRASNLHSLVEIQTNINKMN